MLGKLQLLIAAAIAVLALTPPAHATFPGKNGRIAFASGGEIYTIKSDGTDLLNVTNTPAYESDPAYSASGTRLAYARGPLGNADIYVTKNNAGDNPLQLASQPNADDTDPAWSPDGKRVAFASNRDGDYEIYIAYVAGGPLQKLTDNATPDVHPNWSPNGAAIAYVCNDGDDEICTRPIDPNILGLKLTNNTASDRRPNWSPDGLRVAYASDRDGNYELYVQEGSTAERLTTEPAFDSQPSFAPDGTAIVFASERLGQPRLFKLDLATKAVTPLGGDPIPSELPDWGGVFEFKLVKLPQKVMTVDVQPHGTFAIVEFTQRHASTKAMVQLWTPSKKSGATVKLQTATSDTPRKSWSIKVKNLDPATTYQLHILAYSGNKSIEYKHPTAVKTLERRVMLILNKLSVYDDSDWDGCGDFVFDVQLGDTLARFEKDLCSPGKWEPNTMLVLAKNVKADVVQLKILAVDDDNVYSPPCAPPTPLLPFVFCSLDTSGTGYYGAHKDDGDWAEGFGSLDTSPRSTENFMEDVKVKVKSDGPNLVFRMTALVHYV